MSKNLFTAVGSKTVTEPRMTILVCSYMLIALTPQKNMLNFFNKVHKFLSGFFHVWDVVIFGKDEVNAS